MRTATASLRRIAWIGSICLLSISANHAWADGIPEADLPAPANVTVPVDPPVLDHPMLVLADGRVLAAGGMATSNISAEHKIGASSELWDPQTKQWQVLGNDLRFDPDQRVNLNQMADGRILLFATREGGNTPEYQARIWNPRSNTVEKPAVSARPKPDTDTAVLSDGRVLIVNGNEGSADIWDSRTNTVSHSEEPLLENSRWRALSLKSKQVLLVEMFPGEIRRNVTSSVVLLWNPENREWKQIADLPFLFGLLQSDSLVELSGGILQAGNTREVYRLSALDQGWQASASDVRTHENEQAVALRNNSFPSAQHVTGPVDSTIPAHKQEWWDAYFPPSDTVIETIILLMFCSSLGLFISSLILRKIKKDGEDDSNTNGIHEPTIRQKLNKSWRSIMRGLGFMAIILLLATSYVLWDSDLYSMKRACARESFKLPASQSVDLAEAKQWAACVYEKSGLIEQALFYRTKKIMDALPVVPCRYVGVWSSSMTNDLRSDFSSNDGNYYRFEFTDDSKFRALHTTGNNFFSPPANDPKLSFSGVWGVVDDHMVLIVNPYNSQADHVFDLSPVSRGNFILAGGFREKSEFKLIDAIKSNSCTL
jgi:WD40 repeat protein